MKRSCILVAAVVLFTLLLAAGCGGKGRGEDLYFAMPKPLANTAEGWRAVPWEVYRYTGGETYTLVYTLPDAEDYVLCLAGDHLYYVPLGGGPVTCVELEHCTERILGELPSGGVSYLVAENREWGDRVFALSGKGAQHVLYEVAAGQARVLCEDAVSQAELVLGDGGLFYIDNAQEMALMRYDLKTGEIRKIADKVGVGDLEYDGGYVYSSALDTRRYDVKTGESSFVVSWSGYRVRDGWLYYTEYADDSAGRDPSWVEIMRRNLKSGKTESCGAAYIPYLGSQTFRRTVDFGKKGFLVNITYFKEDTEYMYFPYGAKEGFKLRREGDSP